MKKIFALFILLINNYTKAQNVGINTTTPQSTLEVKSSNQATPLPTDGILIPKIDAFPVTNPAAAQDGMLVYLTTDIGSNLKGFYSWDNASATWKTISASAGSSNFWGLNGNAGTNPATNFIGTTDDVDVVFKRQNFISGRIGTSNTSLGWVSLLNNSSGTLNTAMGFNTLRFNTIGSGNTAFGTHALRQTTIGSGNTAMGVEAGVNNTEGINNVAIGYNSLYTNTLGSQNIAMGYRAMYSSQYGQNNIAIGSQVELPNLIGNNQLNIGNVIYGTEVYGNTAKIGIGVQVPTERLEVAGKIKTNALQVTTGATAGSVLTSDASGNASWQGPSNFSWVLGGNAGTSSSTHFIGTTDDVDLVFKRNNTESGRIGSTKTAFGNQALSQNTIGNYVTAFGSGALKNNTTGSSNTAVGYYSQYFNTTGGLNTSLGVSSLQENTTGDKNVAIGTEALAFNTGGNRNVAVGFESLYFNTFGNNNIAVGTEALQNNTGGYSGLAIGTYALKTNTIGHDNTALGNYAMQNNTTGHYNTAIGTGSMGANSTGQFNTAVGMNSLTANVSGFSNVALGYGTLQNTTGTHNTAVGTSALSTNTSGTHNVALGLFALGNQTTGNNNISVGSNSGANISTGSNNIAIGVNTDVASGTASNQLNIGNIIFGTGLTGSVVNPDGNVGIGLPSPSNKLEINSKLSDKSGLTFTNLTSISPASAGKAIGVSATGEVVTIADNSLNNWSKTGNTGTTPGTNFLGTTDDVDLVFKRNNTLAGKIAPFNTSFGAGALMNNTSPTNYNVAFGTNALLTNTTAESNSAFGINALRFNGTGTANTAVGRESATSNTTASNNTSVGAYTLYYNSIGENNTAIGSTALQNTTAGFNTAIGKAALFWNTSGTSNTATGVDALKANTTGTQNVAMGVGAMTAGTTGSQNTAIGTNAMGFGINSGSANIAVGYAALTKNTSGNSNTALGVYALGENTIGVGNNAVGNALNSNTSGNSNNAMGSRALFGNTTGSTNTAIGHWALETASTGSNNSALGHRAGQLITTGSNNVTIGFNAQVPTFNADNQVSIANVIYATGTGTAGAGNVGIGTGAPATKLDVAGTTKTTNLQMTAGAFNNAVLKSDASGNASWVGVNTLETDPEVGGQVTNQVPRWNGSQLVNGNICDNGWVGIFNTSPQAPLHIANSSGTANAGSQQRAYFHVNTGSNIIQDVSGSGNIIVRADGWYWANGGGFLATSDARIKNIIGLTNQQNDLDILNKIEITNYKYKDEISNGSGLQKKVVAQQLKEIYPIAVNASTGVIPDVLEVAKSVVANKSTTTITTNKPHGFVTGDEVKLILNKSGEKIYKVTTISTTSFTINETITENVFVYGKKVNDLLNVDYDALTTLNISATQELKKEIKKLQQQIEDLTKRLKTTETK